MKQIYLFAMYFFFFSTLGLGCTSSSAPTSGQKQSLQQQGRSQETDPAKTKIPLSPQVRAMYLRWSETHTKEKTIQEKQTLFFQQRLQKRQEQREGLKRQHEQIRAGYDAWKAQQSK